MPPRTTIAERLAMHSKWEGECLVWTGQLTEDGYGHMRFGKKKRLVHRVAWISTYGELSEKRPHVLHTCDNPRCFRLDHLFLGTNADNVADRTAKGRTKNGHTEKTHCIRGHEFNEENTYRPRAGGRGCKKCRRQHVRDYRARTQPKEH